MKDSSGLCGVVGSRDLSWARCALLSWFLIGAESSRCPRTHVTKRTELLVSDPHDVHLACVGPHGRPLCLCCSHRASTLLVSDPMVVHLAWVGPTGHPVWCWVHRTSTLLMLGPMVVHRACVGPAGRLPCLGRTQWSCTLLLSDPHGVHLACVGPNGRLLCSSYLFSNHFDF